MAKKKAAPAKAKKKAKAATLEPEPDREQTTAVMDPVPLEPKPEALEELKKTDPFDGFYFQELAGKARNIARIYHGLAQGLVTGHQNAKAAEALTLLLESRKAAVESRS